MITDRRAKMVALTALIIGLLGGFTVGGVVTQPDEPTVVRTEDVCSTL